MSKHGVAAEKEKQKFLRSKNVYDEHSIHIRMYTYPNAVFNGTNASLPLFFFC